MKRFVSCTILSILLLTLLSGCFFHTGEELYRLPQTPEQYVELQSAIDSVLSAGAEYAAPVSGNNRQSVQMWDLDGDGIDEAIVFFRTEEEKPLKICIFRMVEEKYQMALRLEGDGTSVDSIYYTDLDEDGTREVVVGWKMSDGINKVLTVYKLTGDTATELIRCNYTEYTFSDLDDDGVSELMTLLCDYDTLTGTAECYDFVRGAVTSSKASLSTGISAVTRIKSGRLEDGQTAVFVASTYSDNSVVTDIFALSSKTLKNITLDELSGVSTETVRSSVSYATDIDGDGVMELPSLVQLPAYDPESADRYWKTYWNSYRLDGTPELKMLTYHDYADGWYFILPEQWAEEFTVRRTETTSNEKIVTFYTPGTEGDYLPFLRFYTITGDNKAERAALTGRHILMVRSGTYYCYELAAAYELLDYQIDEAELAANFSVIRSEWNTGKT